MGNGIQDTLSKQITRNRQQDAGKNIGKGILLSYKKMN